MRRRLGILIVPLAALAIAAPSAGAVETIEFFRAGSASTLAGAHADATTAFGLKKLAGIVAGGDPANIVVQTPPGLVGYLQNVPQCPRTVFTQRAALRCPADTQVGLARSGFATSVGHNNLQTLGVFNVQPAPDEPAMLGIQGEIGHVTFSIPILLNVTASNDYAVTATVPEVDMEIGVQLIGAEVTLWGVPAAHERVEGDYNYTNKEGGGMHLPPSPASQWKPFMQNPTGCTSTPITTLRVNTLEEPSIFAEATAESPKGTDCAHVPFSPSISLQPDNTQAGAPAGLNVNLKVPQSNDPLGRGTAELEKIVVRLPQGMAVNPAAASKLLEGCTDAQFAAKSDEPAQCPAGSVIGEDEVESPLVLSGPLKGKLYLGQPLSTDPTSGKMFRIFQELKGFGLDIKLEGSVTANPETGQLTATFANLPELPFEEARFKFRGGANAVLVNPATCGVQTSTAQLTPYSAPEAPVVSLTSSFTTSADGKGAPCPATLPFAPSSAVSSGSSQAGAESPLTVSFARADGTQPLGQIAATLPKGLLGYVSKVPLCEAAQASAGTCPADSRIGTVTTQAGAGEDPLSVTGSVYLARGSDGYPFMLSVVVPAVAGPYDLGNVVVPVWLQVNSDGSITARSGPLPSILDGIPLDVRTVTMSIDRPGFTVNPTSCAPLSLTGTATSLSGATAALSAPFQVAGCAGLAFKPSFGAATQAKTSRRDGASLTVRVAQKAGEAAIAKAHVVLPGALPSRDSTLKKACAEKVFAEDPAKCPRESVVGTVVAYTPLLSKGLAGPAIFVSHGGLAFPDLDLVLQGEGITIVLTGNTNIIKGKITTSTFASVPDVPISGFELNLPRGPYSALAAPGGKLCEKRLLMPTTITGQNGKVVKQKTRIAVSGCAKPKVLAKSARARTATVRVRVPRAGVLSVGGRHIRGLAHRVRHAGTVRLRLHLRSASVAHIARRGRHHRLRVRLRVRFKPRHGERSSVFTTVTFR